MSIDPTANLADDEIDLRFVQPNSFSKTYLCPGCNRDITPGTGHIVAVPKAAPDLRRHWHRGCWNNRRQRRPGRA